MSSNDNRFYQRTLRSERVACEKYLVEELSLLRRYAAAQNGDGVVKTLARLLKTEACKVAAAAEANDHLKNHMRRSDKNVLKVARQLNPWVGTEEPVLFFFEKKSNGELRPLHSFGLENRALQYLVMPTLKAALDFAPNQFACRGGRDQAMTMVKKAIEDGYVYGCELDIKHFYPSINKTWVVDNLVVLPHQVTRRVILPDHYRFHFSVPSLAKGPAGTPTPEEAELTAISLLAANGYAADVRAGLSQGASTSPIIAEWIIASILEDLPAGIVIAYADNILVLGRTKLEATGLANALGARLQAHPGGPFWPKTAHVVKLNQGLHFLGYRISIVGGNPYFEPRASKREEFLKLHGDLLKRIAVAAPSDKVERARDAARHLRSWCAAFKLWDDDDAFKFKMDARNEILKLAGGNVVII